MLRSILCLLLGACLPAGPSRPPLRAPLDLNQATATELLGLPGVGPRTARRIVAFRRTCGGFRRPEEIMSVKGIGERSFARLRPHIRAGALPEPGR